MCSFYGVNLNQTHKSGSLQSDLNMISCLFQPPVPLRPFLLGKSFYQKAIVNSTYNWAFADQKTRSIVYRHILSVKMFQWKKWNGFISWVKWSKAFIFIMHIISGKSLVKEITFISLFCNFRNITLSQFQFVHLFFYNSNSHASWGFTLPHTITPTRQLSGQHGGLSHWHCSSSLTQIWTEQVCCLLLFSWICFGEITAYHFYSA